MKILIIPSATLVSKEMQKKVGKIPTVLCPLREGPVLDNLIEQYKEKVDKIIIVGHNRIDLIQEYVKLKKLDIMVLELDVLKDLGYTIRYGIEKAYEEYSTLDEVYINFADTLVSDLFEHDCNNNVFYSNECAGDEWTYFSYNDRGELEHIWDKTDIDNNCENLSNPTQLFVGAFKIADAKVFLDLLVKEDISIDDNCDTFYKALYSYSHIYKINYIYTDKWLDVGHTENYFKAKTGVEARVFNTLEIDDKRGIIKKSSENKEKLINEIKWYLRLPGKLQYLIPRIYKYSVDIENPYVEMEYYGYSTLHELLIWGDLPIQQWRKYFSKLKFIVDDMQNYKYIEDDSNLDKSVQQIYVGKTINRLESLRSDKEFCLFFENPVSVNGIQYRTLNEYIEILPDMVNQLLLKNWKREFNIIHGDLCFSNILIENNYGFMRIIDPRGEFGDCDIYGDSRYEMAKLLHSIEGKYDFIIEDMFTIERNNNCLKYSIKEKNTEILSVFKEVFSNEIENYSALQLIEATLFLSMIPLHKDYPDRQLAMLATGVQLFESVLNEMHK